MQIFCWLRLPLMTILLWLPLNLYIAPAQASVDPYITRYLRVTDPVELAIDKAGNSRLFSAEELSSGKQLFEQNCINCHVGGSTLPDPSVPLSLAKLAGATPSRDTISGLVNYLRQPMTYDGAEETFWCRQVPESWLPQGEIEALAGFVLRAAQTAPGWGTETFSDQ